MEINNSGTFYPDWDDFVWVACKNNTLVGIYTLSGQIISIYGGTGSGVGQFNGIEAVTSGRSFLRGYADTDTLYVVDSGNSRLVRLRWYPGTVQWLDYWPIPSATSFTDLDADNFGQIWATERSGYIYKFTSDLELLGTYSLQSDGLTRLTQPSSVSNPGGYLGAGGLVVCDEWTDSSGVSFYDIGTDVCDLYVNSFEYDTTCFSWINFVLADWSGVRIYVYDEWGQLVRNLFHDTTYVMMSGSRHVGWNGTDDMHRAVPDGQYRVEVKATSCYIDPETVEPVNEVAEDVWVTLCDGSCEWLVGDADGNGIWNISDAVYLIAYIFGGGGAPVTPTAPGSSTYPMRAI